VRFQLDEVFVRLQQCPIERDRLLDPEGPDTVALQLERETVASAHSREEASLESQDLVFLASMDQPTAKALVIDEKLEPSKLYRAITE